MNQITLRANAKINLSLDIIGRREDGYHLMDMIMQSVDLCDLVRLEKGTDIRVSLLSSDNGSALSIGENNTAHKAAAAFFRYTGLPGGVSVQLTKHIPQEAGMAGGSADAAAVLIGLDKLYETGLSRQEFLDIGVTVGADVPFCLVGGTARVRGIGENILPQPMFGFGHYLIVKPPFGISTPLSFKRFDTMDSCRRPDNDALLAAMASHDLPQMQRVSANVLEQAAESPEIEAIKQRLRSLGAGFSLMTGSGSAVFGLFAEKEAAAQAAEPLSDCGRVYLAAAAPAGVQVADFS